MGTARLTNKVRIPPPADEQCLSTVPHPSLSLCCRPPKRHSYKIDTNQSLAPCAPPPSYTARTTVSWPILLSLGVQGYDCNRGGLERTPGCLGARADEQSQQPTTQQAPTQPLRWPRQQSGRRLVGAISTSPLSDCRAQGGGGGSSFGAPTLARRRRRSPPFIIRLHTKHILRYWETEYPCPRSRIFLRRA